MLETVQDRLLLLENTLEYLRGYFDVDNKRRQINEISSLISRPEFWDEQANSAKVVKELKVLKAAIEPWEAAFKRLIELKELAEITSESDRELALDLAKNTELLSKEIEELEFKTLLSGEFDRNNAILSINAGAGGTESCDWANMLLRMYHRYAERHGYSVKGIDILFGEEAGIKNVTVLIEGEYAYGYLKSERGVHRLVRISPFDANKRRHTSFASVDVIPEVEEDVDVILEDKDLKIEVYRSKGAGGQSVNTTDSAVRITHLPTGLTAQCQNERSQYQNKQTAFKILKARIYEFQRQKKEDELLKRYGADKKKIEFGSQIRSYVMHPYNLVKDHRTNFETSDVNAVMDGKIDEFIKAYLKYHKTKT
ncbi:MAG: peptide chain release factor 2 [Candidatus Omnitrophica bacterium]|nr:peptide chain release factor 2 [Candidatus Omnitrophota bacterium]